MITLSDIVKGDLIDNVNNFDIMVIIYTPGGNFYISTREQHFTFLLPPIPFGEEPSTEEEVYFEDLDAGDGQYTTLLDIDFEKGCRKAGDLIWTPWAMEGSEGEAYLAVAECPAGSAGVQATTSNCFIFEEPFPEGGESKYEMNTGFVPQDMFYKYKTITRVGKRMYIGNLAEMGGSNKTQIKKL